MCSGNQFIDCAIESEAEFVIRCKFETRGFEGNAGFPDHHFMEDGNGNITNVLRLDSIFNTVGEILE
jgi:hypothetical protein